MTNHACFMTLVDLIMALCLISDPVPAQTIRVPSTPPPELPAPPLGIPLALTGEYVYVIDSDVPFKLFASPDGLLKVTKEEGPVRYRGKFVGGNGKVETKTFKGKYLAFLEASPNSKGDVEIIIDPTESKDEIVAIRQKLRVDSLIAPQPPPIIVPPDPVTPTDPVTTAFQAAFDAEPATVADKNGKVWSKVDYAKKLAGLYAGAANVTVKDPSVKTYGELFADLKSAALFPDTAMPTLKKAVGGYLDIKLQPSTLKAIDRDKTSAEFLYVASILNNLKGVK